MRNKNKKINVKFFTAALIGVVVFLLNAGVVGAQITITDITCIHEKKCETEKELIKKCEEPLIETKKTDLASCDDAHVKALTPCEDVFFPETCKKIANEDFTKCKKLVDIKINDAKKACAVSAKKTANECTEKANTTCTSYDFTNEIAATTSGLIGEALKCKQNYFESNIKACQNNQTFNNKKIETAKQALECFIDLKSKSVEACKGTCGNKLVEGDEECDDGNKIKGDGCTDLCKKEDVFRVADMLKIDEGQSYLERSEGSDAANSTSLKKGLIFIVIQFIELLTKIIGSLALLMVIVGGLILMISSGNSQLQQKGKRIILYAILGLVIAFLSLVIVTTIQSLFYTT